MATKTAIRTLKAVLLMAALCVASSAQAQQLTGPITPVVTASALKGAVLKAAAGHLYAAYATNITSTAGFFVLIDTAAVPADGAITPLACVALPANGTVGLNYVPSPPVMFRTGVTAVVTSASTCYTLTSGTITAFISGLVE